MISRHETQHQLKTMLSEIRRQAQDGTFSSHEMLPSTRELARRYNISHNLAALGLKSLIEEGVLYSVPRIGTFVGRPPAQKEGVFLLLLQSPQSNPTNFIVQIGFEERIAQLGGSCLTMERQTACEAVQAGEFPPILGVFEFDETMQTPDLWGRKEIVAPHVRFGEYGKNDEKGDADLIYFDNVGGGRTATQHLLELRHTPIAFLGLHGKNDEVGEFLWSQERAQGWSEALKGVGVETRGLLFQPEKTPPTHIENQLQVGHQVAKQMLGTFSESKKLPAIVAVNRYVAEGLFNALREAKISSDEWPVVVAFDVQAMECSDKAAQVTVLRLPWEEVGRAGANLLWTRDTQQLASQFRQILVPMRLIRRLSCRREWISEASKITKVFTSSQTSTVSI